MNAVEWLRTLGPVLGSVPQTKILGSGAEEIARRYEAMEKAIYATLHQGDIPMSGFHIQQLLTDALEAARAPIDKEAT